MKPHNCLLDGRGHMQLADFGLAMQVKPGMQVHRIVGSPGYQSPEMMSKENNSASDDWWGLGCTLFRALCDIDVFKYIPKDEEGSENSREIEVKKNKKPRT